MTDDVLIDPTARVSPRAKLGQNVSIGAFSIIRDNVEIADNSVIHSHCDIGLPPSDGNSTPLRIGPSSLIRSHSVFYANSTFGPRLATGHRVTVRDNTQVGENFLIGTLSEIQGHCTIGDYVRFQSNVLIGQKSVLGNFIWIFPNVVLTNDPHPPSDTLIGPILEDYVAVSTMSVIQPGVTLRRGALVAAHSRVVRDAPEDMIVVGNPAKTLCATSRLRLKDGSRKPAYPWRRHFHRGYPIDVVEDWKAEFDL